MMALAPKKLSEFDPIDPESPPSNIRLFGVHDGGNFVMPLGMVPIPLVQPTYPVAYVDIPLYPVFPKFILEVLSLELDDADSLQSVFGVNGTFVGDEVEYDSYRWGQVERIINDAAPATVDVIDVTLSLDPGVVPATLRTRSASLYVDIFPGSSEYYASVVSHAICPRLDAHAFPIRFSTIVGGISPDAINAAAPARMDTLRCLPYGNGDFDPPTGSVQIVGGHWILHGIIT